MTDEIAAFAQEVDTRLRLIGQDAPFGDLSRRWLEDCIRVGYPRNFSWLGRPIVQIPQDIYAVQELVWTVRPDLIIETGIAHGGSLVLSASMLALLDYCDAIANGRVLDPRAGRRRVIGVDIDIRAHNRAAIEAHPLSPLIEMIEGSSVADDVISAVKQRAGTYERVLVLLDSNHTHDHVLAELRAYAPLVSRGSYCVVWDSGLEALPEGFVTDRPWGKGNNPNTAVHAYLRELDAGNSTLHFEIEKTLEHKLTLTSTLDGFLRRTA